MYQYQLKQTAFREYLERERREWLAAGMSEAEIYEVHFGKPDEDGRGGDYGVWLSERKHNRGDRKYAPGVPIAIDTVDPESAWIADGQNAMSEVEFEIDFAAALATLTELQRYCFVEDYLNGKTHQEIAAEKGISRQMVDKHYLAAEKKIKNIFQG